MRDRFCCPARGGGTTQVSQFTLIIILTISSRDRMESVHHLYSKFRISCSRKGSPPYIRAAVGAMFSCLCVMLVSCTNDLTFIKITWPQWLDPTTEHRADIRGPATSSLSILELKYWNKAMCRREWDCVHTSPFCPHQPSWAPPMIQSNRSNLYQWGKLENIHEAVSVQLEIWGDFVWMNRPDQSGLSFLPGLFRSYSIKEGADINDMDCGRQHTMNLKTHPPPPVRTGRQM